jgi:hypothetical protein
MAEIERDFFLDGMPVGYFDGQDFPSCPGSYQYMPYRGGGHYRMQLQLSAGESPRCTYDCGNTRVSFIVSGCPEYGVLELRDFDRSSRRISELDS